MKTIVESNWDLLCPVPCDIIEDALHACRAHGRVAFGSQMVEMFYDPKTQEQLIKEGRAVYIYVSSTGGKFDKKSLTHFTPDKVTYIATYLKWSEADDRGKHKNPAIRPKSALTDTAVIGFWEVADLQPLPKSKYIGLRGHIPRHPEYYPLKVS